MNTLLELPWVPFLSLVAIVPLIVWQIRVYFKEKQRNRTPKVPQINLEAHKENTNNKDVKNVTLISNLKARNKNSKKTSLVFSITIVVFVIVNVFIVTFYLKNRRLSYLPRATDSVSPTIANLNPIDETNEPTNIPTPETTVSITSTNTPTIASITPTTIPTPTSTTIPTKAAVQTPTANPTLLAQAYSVPTYAPSPTQTPKPTQTPTVNPTKTPLITKSQTIIPVVGISQFSVVLGIISLLFLVLGLVL